MTNLRMKWKVHYEQTKTQSLITHNSFEQIEEIITIINNKMESSYEANVCLITFSPTLAIKT